MIKKIFYKNKVIEPNHKSFPKRYKLFACDTETVDGLPYTLQLYDGKEIYFKYVNKNNILDIFLEYLYGKGLSRQVNIVYFHNLEYDISVIFYKFHKKFLERKTLIIQYENWYIKLVLGNTTFAVLKKGNKKFICLDSQKFINTSLENFAKLINSKFQKLKRPEFLGVRKPKTKEEKKVFEDYSKQDVLVQYEISKWILEQHKKYNVCISYSNANFSERIFRHYFIKSYMNIKLPPKEWIKYSIFSYHGGKNGYYLNKEKGVYFIRDAVELDIVSAYPYAMTMIPNFSKGKYIEVDKVVDEYEGIYVVSGVCLNDMYPILYSHDFKPIPKYQIIEDLCLTSYELKEAIRNNEIEIKKVKGLVFQPYSVQENPLKNFVMEFFTKKDTAKVEEEKLLYKIILNSLYGKFIQSIEDEDKKKKYVVDTKRGKVHRVEKTYIAGQMFNPFIASLITGFVRTHIHKFEHLGFALHTSTDSIIIKKNNLDKLKPYIKKELGGLEIKCQGDVYLFRNKLYIFVDKNGNIIKHALHGFLGTPEQLLNMLYTKTNFYKVKKMVKVREAERIKKKKLKKLAINEMERCLRDVNLNNLIIY